MKHENVLWSLYSSAVLGFLVGWTVGTAKDSPRRAILPAESFGYLQRVLPEDFSLAEGGADMKTVI